MMTYQFHSVYQIHVNNIKVECLTCLEIQVQANEQYVRETMPYL